MYRKELQYEREENDRCHTRELKLIEQQKQLDKLIREQQSLIAEKVAFRTQERENALGDRESKFLADKMERLSKIKAEQKKLNKDKEKFELAKIDHERRQESLNMKEKGFDIKLKSSLEKDRSLTMREEKMNSDSDRLRLEKEKLKRHRRETDEKKAAISREDQHLRKMSWYSATTDSFFTKEVEDNMKQWNEAGEQFQEKQKEFEQQKEDFETQEKKIRDRETLLGELESRLQKEKKYFNKKENDLGKNIDRFNSKQTKLLQAEKDLNKRKKDYDFWSEQLQEKEKNLVNVSSVRDTVTPFRALSDFPESPRKRQPPELSLDLFPDSFSHKSEHSFLNSHRKEFHTAAQNFPDMRGDDLRHNFETLKPKLLDKLFDGHYKSKKIENANKYSQFLPRTKIQDLEKALEHIIFNNEALRTSFAPRDEWIVRYNEQVKNQGNFNRKWEHVIKAASTSKSPSVDRFPNEQPFEHKDYSDEDDSYMKDL